MSENSSASTAPARGTNFISAIPEGDNRTRQVCADCGFINYENPKIVVGAVCHWGDRILMCAFGAGFTWGAGVIEWAP